ncbi:hypothetical protein NUW58_g4057 [Xylaria curta]|uniref:Uncharacterized protein n=1 Tax=Xylaria curta TaxID=42375 RepID=A0ACC1P9E8_9PEZI|nr:hypothetical protein NUW58_g4057 [Xylaria curta]
MVTYRLIAVASFLASVNGLPLNINLGAYSPALVVGDGEISFGGGQDVTNLLNALEGAAVTSATANGGATNGAAQDIQLLNTPSGTTPPAGTTVASQGGETAVTTPKATPAAVDTNTQEQGTPHKPYHLKEWARRLPLEKTQNQRPNEISRASTGHSTYAEAALTKGPLIQLGTGEGGAGVGIIVDNRPNAAPREGERAAAKRDEMPQPRRRTKVTRMYVKRGIPAAVQSSPDLQARAVEPLPTFNLTPIPKRDNSEAIDAINLNIPADEGVTMTFVETTDDDEASD